MAIDAVASGAAETVPYIAVTNLARVTFPGVRLQGLALTDTGNLVVSDANSNAGNDVSAVISQVIPLAECSPPEPPK